MDLGLSDKCALVLGASGGLGGAIVHAPSNGGARVVGASRATIPTGRYGRPRKFAAIVAFLAGEPASRVAGSVVRVDGGLIRSI